MISPNISSHSIDIVNRLCVHESSTIIFDSRESMKILHEMLTDFESTFWSLRINEKLGVQLHSLEYFLENRASTVGEKTPGIPK
jgi:hypothetical protein